MHPTRIACCTQATALNASNAGELKHVIRPWHERRQRDQCLARAPRAVGSRRGRFRAARPQESNDGDPELLLFIPFTSDVKAPPALARLKPAAAHLSPAARLVLGAAALCEAQPPAR